MSPKLIMFSSVCLVCFTFAGFLHVTSSEDVWPPVITPNCTLDDCGKKLFLTSYLKTGRISEAREAARVPPLEGHVESYSGFFTVDEQRDFNAFFWFFPSESGRESPVVLVLDGTPAGTSFLFAFNGVGPYWVDDDGQFKTTNTSWTKTMNVLYVDALVGAGFSFKRHATEYTVNRDEVTRTLYSVLTQFFRLFPELENNQFYMYGFEYAAKFIISLAHFIHTNHSAPIKINLQGLMIEEGLVDLVNQLGYSDYFYYLGLIDDGTKKEFAQIEEHIQSLVEEKRYEDASREYMKLMSGTRHYPTVFNNATGLKDYHNYVNNNFLPVRLNVVCPALEQLLSQPAVRKKLHVGDQAFKLFNVDAFFALAVPDMFLSAAPQLEVLLDQHRVLVFNGQLGIVMGYPMAMNYVRKLKWTGADEYLGAKRRQWHVQGELAGYAKTGGHLTEVLVRDAGATILEKPALVQDLIERFIDNLPIGE